MIGAKWFDIAIGVDIHFVLVPAPPAPPIPTPLPHPFVGLIFDPTGLIVGSVIGAVTGACKGATLINKMPAATTGTEVTNKMVMPHFPMPPGIMWAMIPSGPKPPIPGEVPPVPVPVPVPTNDGTIITGSKTVYISGSNAARLGSMAMTCAEPVRLPSTNIIAIPMGPPVLIGGPPALDFMAAAMSFIKTKWISDKLHAFAGAHPESWRSKVICFFTGHPVDVASGKVLTDHVDIELPGPIPFKFDRTYNSGSEYDGPLGHCWGHSYDQFVYIDADEDRLVYHEGEGRDVYFDLIEPGQSTRNHFARMDCKRNLDSVTITTKDNLTYHFHNVGHEDRLYLTAITDTNDSRLTFKYNDNAILFEVVDSVGRRITFVNDVNGRLAAITLPHPYSDSDRFTAMKFSYDDNGDLVKATDAKENSFIYKYKYHLLVQETNRNGLSFYFAYNGIDKDAQCVRTWGDDGIYDHQITYANENNITIVENSLGNITTYMMDDNGAVVKIVQPNGGETKYDYNDIGWKISETDPIGNVTKFEYDDLGNTIKTIDPDDTAIQVTYNEFNLPVQAIDKVGGQWSWSYDDRLRLIKRKDPLERVNRFEYNGKYLSRFIDSAGLGTFIAFDNLGNLRALTTPDGMQCRWNYDYLGRCIESYDPKRNLQRNAYDLLDNIIQVDEPDGNIRKLNYDAEGNIISASDRQYSVAFEYRGMNRMAARIQNNTRVEFNYDTEERLTAIKNEHGSVYSFELDTLGDVLVEHGFDKIRRKYWRDLAGNIFMVERPDNVFSEYSYDQLGRVKSIIHTDGEEEHFTYREDGELIAAENSHTKLKFERNILGIIEKEWQNDHWVSSSFDKLDMRIKMQSSMGALQTIKRSIIGDVEKMNYANEHLSTGKSWETQYRRDELGLEIGRILPGGVQSKWKRDKLGRPIELSINVANKLVRTRSYSWDINDRLQQIEDSLSGTTVFAHDAFGNLAKATYSDGTSLFRAPDAIGNLYRSPDRTDRKYGPAGQLLESSTDKGVVKYEYDAEGNLTRKIEPGDKEWGYSWNSSGMLSIVKRPDGRRVKFTYDPLGRRMSKSFNGRITKWIWDGNVILHEWVEHFEDVNDENEIQDSLQSDETSTASLKAQLDGRPSNGPPDEESLPDPTTWLFDPDTFAPASKIVGDKHYSIITDHLGTPLSMFDEKGVQTWAAELDIYGTVKNLQGEKSYCPFRFPGQYEDSETGLYYNRFRYYDAEGGEYVSQDPIGLLGGKLQYSYTSDTFTFFDALGLSQLIDGMPLDDSAKLFRIGGNSIDNLRLKPPEMKLTPPGISLIRANTAEEAGQLMKKAFPNASKLHAVIDAGNIAETTAAQIRNAGFDVIHNPTNNLGDVHARLIHPQGVNGFSDPNLDKLSQKFTCS
jgi:RHS repeat-associated protein